jgi:hypothetical protein
MPLLETLRYKRKTDKPGVFCNGIGWEEMRAGDKTYLIYRHDTEQFYRVATREPRDVWVGPKQINDAGMWVDDEEQTAVVYDWFENMQ